MKKVFLLLLVIGFVVSLSACGNKSVQNTIEIQASDDTVAYREAMFERLGYSKRSNEEIMDNFYNSYIPSREARTGQTFPEVETTNKLEKETYDYGDVYTLSGDIQDKIVLYIHGGAWIEEIDQSHVSFCDKLVDTLGAKVYMVLYPLAPQADYTQSYQMIEQVYDKLLEQNKPIIVMGDSAGGTISLGLVLSLKDSGKKLPEQVVVMAPCADATFTNSEIDEYQESDGMLYKAEVTECAKIWANGADLTIPQISPINGDYNNFPDTLMFVGDHDILCPDDLKLYDKMCKAGINATLVKGIGLWHVYPVFSISEQQDCLDIIRDFCK